MATTVITAVCARMFPKLRGVANTGESRLSATIRPRRIRSGPIPSRSSPSSRPDAGNAGAPPGSAVLASTPAPFSIGTNSSPSRNQKAARPDLDGLSLYR